ncbi:trypco2 family protein [Streptomyces sp. S.PB5]|uniref:trypco2 family protein n=1 Tax=Streptomyces sp. S.PB5 TaxID=3020844 RepID=UPI0025AFF68E|nr:trypco2 family protein [Streptomyces sp. S.PB5]MDN3028433.1 hypothetical protein [Streptomyces sp. S.PB5]
MGSTDSEQDDELDLADAIALLRTQVAQAQARIATEGEKGVLFVVEEVTLQLGVELARTKGVGGDLRFSVIGIGGRRERVDRTTHTVTVQLKPHKPGGGDVDVCDTE